MPRHRKPPEEILTRKDLADLQQRLSMMSIAASPPYKTPISTPGVPHLSGALSDCEGDTGLVQAWKQMRKWR